MERKDSWTDEEDRLLAETVLAHIRQGGTQLAAFEDVSELLFKNNNISRSAAACGFRWNSTVRKSYENEITNAKEEKKSKKSRVSELIGPTIKALEAQPKEPQSNYDIIADLIQNTKENILTIEKLVDTLHDENVALKQKYFENQQQGNSEDYAALIRILDQARKLGIIRDDGTGQTQFKMDTNGNLEKIG